MKENRNISLFQDSFPSIIREYESYLALNVDGVEESDYIQLGENKLPVDFVNEAEIHLGSLYQNNELTMEDISQINQALAYLSLRIGYSVLYSKATTSPILLPEKDNYLGIGEKSFVDVFTSMVNLNTLTNKMQQDTYIKFLKDIVSQERFRGRTLTLELRLINIMIILLKVMNNTVSVSFLSQLLIQQYELSKKFK